MFKKEPKIKTSNSYTIFGLNNCFELIKSNKFNIHEIFIYDKKYNSLKNKINLNHYKNKLRVLDKIKFYRLFQDYRSQGIVINFGGEIEKNFNDYSLDSEQECLLILDQIEDPQNAGQIIRTAECAGIGGIIFSRHKSFKISNTVLNVSQGAFVNIPLFNVTNIKNVIINLKKNGFWIIGIDNIIDSKNWNEIDYSGKTAIVVGSEGKGIRKQVLNLCDFIGCIPMQGCANSLNVSAAVSAILFERLRQLKYNLE